MTLSFPNESRSYDSRRNLVRFWGYDSALEISFFVETGALHKLSPLMRDGEEGHLEAFDSARDRIYETASKLYSRARTEPYFLAAADF